jgi:type IV pilus biogenesis/stability protein PilW
MEPINITAKMVLSRERARAIVRLLFICALFLIVTGCATSTDVEVQRLQARSLYEQAVKSLAERQVSLGLTSLREAVRLDPQNPTFRNTLGVVLLDLRKPTEAEAEFRKAVELDPNYAEAHHNLGLSFAEQGQWDQAIAQYRKAISLPTYATPEVGYYNLGRAYAQTKRLREAEESLRTAIQLDPKLGAAHYQLGAVLATAGRPEEAKEALRRARDLDPNSPFGRAAIEALKTLGEGS